MSPDERMALMMLVAGYDGSAKQMKGIVEYVEALEASAYSNGWEDGRETVDPA